MDNFSALLQVENYVYSLASATVGLPGILLFFSQWLTAFFFPPIGQKSPARVLSGEEMATPFPEAGRPCQALLNFFPFFSSFSKHPVEVHM